MRLIWGMVSKSISQKMGISCLNQIQRSAALVVVVIQEHREITCQGGRGVCGRTCMQVPQYNGWKTLLQDVSSGQLVLRSQWPRFSSVITKVKNPLKACSQCGRAQQECPAVHSCFLLDWSVHARLFQPVYFIHASPRSSRFQTHRAKIFSPRDLENKMLIFKHNVYKSWRPALYKQIPLHLLQHKLFSLDLFSCTCLSMVIAN